MFIFFSGGGGEGMEQVLKIIIIKSLVSNRTGKRVVRGKNKIKPGNYPSGPRAAVTETVSVNFDLLNSRLSKSAGLSGVLPFCRRRISIQHYIYVYVHTGI